MYHHERPREVLQQRSTVRLNLWEGGGPRRTAVEGWVGFFFVCSYSLATYLDHGGVHFSPFPVHRLREAAHCEPPLALFAGLPGKDKGNDKGKAPPPGQLLPFCWCHEQGGGKGQWGFLPAIHLVLGS